VDRDLSESELQTLADRIADTAAHIDAATHLLLTDIRVFDETRSWFDLGAKSCAEFLSWRIGMGPGVAREKVRVARALGELPRVDAALAEGRLSYSKVRAITRVATPENEETLLEMALASTAAQLEKICRLYRQTAPRERTEDERRWLHHRVTDDGMVRISMQLQAEEAALVLKAIDVSAGSGSPADRMVALAEQFLSGDPGRDTESTGRDTEATGRDRGSTGRDTGSTGRDDHAPADNENNGSQEREDAAAGARGRDRRGSGARVRRPVEVMLHVDAATLTGHLHDTGDGVSAETVRRLCCDAGIVPVLEGAGKTLDVGRKTRRLPAALERALENRDRGCRFPGCTNHRFTDAHHIEHWLNGGETRLDNLVQICRRHHGFVHERGFTVEMTDDGPVFRTPAGVIVPETFDRPALSRPVESLRGRISTSGVDIAPDAQIPNWDGTPPDYEYVVDILANHGGPPAA
jgi:hypothetical protein